MLALKWLALLVGVVAVMGLGAFAPAILPASTTAGTASTTTTGTTCTSTTSPYTSSTTATSSTATSSSTEGTFTYSPSGPVRVTSVQADIYGGSGEPVVSFSVTFENSGSSAIYTAAGCGSGLTATLAPDSTVLQEIVGGPRCLCAEIMTPVAPGETHESVAPGCWSGYHFVLTHPGTVEVDFVLSWSGGVQNSSQPGTTNVTAWFTF